MVNSRKARRNRHEVDECKYFNPKQERTTKTKRLNGKIIKKEIQACAQRKMRYHTVGEYNFVIDVNFIF